MTAGLDGGQRAARGLHYQYLRTLEELLHLAEQEQSDAHVVYVEGNHSSQSDTDDPTLLEIIDYEVCNNGGRRLKIAQVKSVDSPEDAASMGPSAILRVFIELVGTGADSYQLITNARLQDPAANWTKGLLPPDNDMLGALRLACRASPKMNVTLDALSNDQLTRLRRCRVVRDGRRSDQLRSDLILRLRRYRQSRNVGVGNAAAGLLAKSLIGDLLSKAGKKGEDRAVFLDTFRRAILTDRSVVAVSLGAFDWGIPIGAAPLAASSVERPGLLAKLFRELDFGIVKNTIRTCVLTGPSGLGKTNLVASYLREYGGAYDIAFWIDCESPDAVSTSWSRIGRVLGADWDDARFLDPRSAPAEHALSRAAYPRDSPSLRSASRVDFALAFA